MSNEVMIARWNLPERGGKWDQPERVGRMGAYAPQTAFSIVSTETFTGLLIEKGTTEVGDIVFPTSFDATLNTGQVIEVPINSWTDVDTYDKDTAGFYSFEAVYDAPEYVYGTLPTVGIEVEVRSKYIEISSLDAVITTDGDHKVVKFNASGEFDIESIGIAAELELLIVAGGGSGGTTHLFALTTGGGGAGGMLEETLTTDDLSLNTFQVVVGAGGQAPPDTGAQTGESGEDSTVFDFTAIGGGGGGAYNANPSAGGSGGGAYPMNSGTRYGADGTVGQGNDGGDHTMASGTIGGISWTTYSFGGGGGGAGGAGIAPNIANGYIFGQNQQGLDPSNEGAGKANSITGSSITYAKGGRGGAPLEDTSVYVFDNADANSGDGGAGSCFNKWSGTQRGRRGFDGGSGVVILRYKFQN